VKLPKSPLRGTAKRRFYDPFFTTSVTGKKGKKEEVVQSSPSRRGSFSRFHEGGRTLNLL